MGREKSTHPWDAFEDVFASVRELEPRSRHEVAHSAGDEYFRRCRSAFGTSGHVDRHAANIITAKLDLAGVDASADR